MRNLVSKEKLKRLFLGEPSPKKFAWSCATGVFIAFSPYLGIQTLLIFAAGWLLSLNIPLTFAIVYLVNNPWTMIPIIIMNHAVGMWIGRVIFHTDLSQYNPVFMHALNNRLDQLLTTYTKLHTVKLSLWAYLIGGHVVALTLACITYIVAKASFHYLTRAKTSASERSTSERSTGERSANEQSGK
jgi:uncharacterized protein (DUF2062 family)